MIGGLFLIINSAKIFYLLILVRPAADSEGAVHFAPLLRAETMPK